jgi:uncharacterized SAM-binding protein YcdF (DUF218 family)
MIAWRRRALLRVTAGVAVLGAAALVCFLPFAGRYLVTEDALERSDAIVVLAGARAERWLEAVDLYRAGWAPHILLSRGRIEDAELKLQEMGIQFPEEAVLVRDAMVQMKIPPEAIAFIPGAIDNTAGEAAATRAIAAAAGWRRVIVVTSKYHSRRTRFAFDREFRGVAIRVLVRPSRYDTVTPERWWTRRADVRYVTSELQKLLAYRLGLGG